MVEQGVWIFYYRDWEGGRRAGGAPGRGYSSQVIGGSGVYEQKVPVLSAVCKCHHSGRCAFWMRARLVRRHLVTALRTFSLVSAPLRGADQSHRRWRVALASFP